MRETLRAHAPAFSGFAMMVTVALVLSASIQAGVVRPATPVPVVPSDPIPLPAPEDDRDGDSYHDDVDLVDGDLHLRVEVTALRAPDRSLPFLHLGTQDDHWRTGLGAALEWPHVVDVDPFGHRPGSPGWHREVVRTGAWWTSEPMDGARKAMSEGSVDPEDVPDGVRWPQVFWINLRDDRTSGTVEVHLRDARPSPDAYLGRWELRVDALGDRARVGDEPWSPAGANLTATADGVRLTLRATLEVGPSLEEQREWAERWAPRLHFDEGERFYPVNGSVLQRFHGFGRLDPRDHDHRTWTREFNNGRDPYLLLLADFNGDRVTDHVDAALMYDVLTAGDVGAPTVHASVAKTTGDRVVVTYWFLYMYNFVRDVTGTDIQLLAHAGDREFVSLLFRDEEAVRDGAPEAVSYSQHYYGIRIPHPEPGREPFSGNDTHPDVFVAQGSHASYPVAGDDRRFRPAFAGYGDRFDGLGVRWEPDDYDLVVLGGQEWHQGYLWGPLTRHSRDLGTSTRPLLQHSFQYPHIDPVSWHHSMTELPVEDLREAYGEDE